MKEKPNKSEHLFSSWLRHADRWIDLLSEPPQSINKGDSDKSLLAILDQKSPNSILDLGCSDGSIVDYFTNKGKKAVGVDTIEEFIAFAKATKTGYFYHCESTSELPNLPALVGQKFDIIVLNHGVFINEDLSATLLVIQNLLTDKGEVIIQTIHPTKLTQSDIKYENTWQACYWELPTQLAILDAPYPMYIRTFSSWFKLFSTAKFKITDICEPIIGESKKPNSLLFVCSKYFI